MVVIQQPSIGKFWTWGHEHNFLLYAEVSHVAYVNAFFHVSGLWTAVVLRVWQLLLQHWHLLQSQLELQVLQNDRACVSEWALKSIFSVWQRFMDSFSSQRGIIYSFMNICFLYECAQDQVSSLKCFPGCETYMDIVIVLDGSNSIYPWNEVQSFLVNILQKFYIGPGQIQVCKKERNTKIW